MASITSLQSAYAGFSPTSIPGCVLWLDAADASTIVRSGASVTQWNDKSSNAYTFAGVNSPTLLQNQVNNLPVMNFVGSSNQYFDGGATSTIPFIHTRFAVYRNTFSNVGQSLTGSANQGSFTQQGGGVAYQDTAGYTDQSIAFQTGSSYRILSVLIPFSGLFPQPNGTVFFNGTQIPLVSNTGGYGTTNPPTQIYIGSGNQKYTGTIAEVLFYNGLLSTTQRQQIEGYLAAKWGLQSNLPSTHPYRSIPIVTRPFLPVDVPGCQLWLDAADTSSMTLNGSFVTQWSDKSGNGYAATATTSYAPTRTARINGLPVISSPQNKYMLLANFNQNFTTASCFFVLKPTEDITPNNKTPNGYPAYVVIGGNTTGYIQTGVGYDNPVQTSSTNYFSVFLYQNGNGFLNGRLGGASPSTYNPNGEVMLVSQVHAASTSTNGAFQNGTSLPLTASSTSTFSNFSGITIRIAGNDNGFSFGYDLAEVILYGSVLSTIQRQQIEAYLAQKWGLRTNLLSTHPFRLALPAAPVFTPLAVANCAMWLDAADPTVVIRSGSTVTTWNDKSGNGRNATATAGTATYSNSGVNFNTSTFSTSLTAAPSAETIFVVGTFTGTANNGHNWILGGNAQPARALSVYKDAGGTSFIIDYWGGTGWVMGRSGPTPNTRFLGMVVYTGTTATPELNGAALGTSGNVTFAGSSTTTIGSTGGGGNFPGIINELIIYSAALTTSQRQQVEGYLAAKWNLKGVFPDAHPYKKITP